MDLTKEQSVDLIKSINNHGVSYNDFIEIINIEKTTMPVGRSLDVQDCYAIVGTDKNGSGTSFFYPNHENGLYELFDSWVLENSRDSKLSELFNECEHEFIERDYLSAPYGRCMSCSQLIVDSING